MRFICLPFRFTCLVLAALLVACGGAGVKSDWERKNETRLEQEARDPVPAPPAFPRKENLVEIALRGATDFRFYVDGATLGVGDGVVRYVLVARSPAGVENVSFEAIRCATAEYRVYALGRSDGATKVLIHRAIRQLEELVEEGATTRGPARRGSGDGRAAANALGSRSDD